MTAPAEKPDKTKSKVKPEPEPAYVIAWRKLINATPHPMSLLSRWHAERDERDKLKVPITLRLDLLRQVAPAEVEPLQQTTPATGGKTSRQRLTTTTTTSTTATNKG
jgi:hypothetical protein